MNKDQSIVTQVAAKIASELTNTTAIPDRSPDAIRALYLSHFDFVSEVLNNAHGFDANVSAETEQHTVHTPTTPQFDPASAFPNSSYESGHGIKVINAQHGPLPAWLVTACQKAGVTQVWDNRDTATPANRRPLFKAADGPKDKNGKPLAFWEPRKG